MSEQYDIAVIGAGPGGYSAALRAAQLGMSVALIEKDATLGGTCLNRGCIPSKALITATHAIDVVRHASALGVQASVDGIDYGRLRDYRENIVAAMTQGLASLVAQRGITVLHAAVTGLTPGAPASDGSPAPLTLALTGAPVERVSANRPAEPLGRTVDIQAREVVVATGGRPRPLPGHPFSGALIDSTQALELDAFPASAVVIGAGAVAVEFASLWNAAGVDVTLIIRRDRVLSAWDRRSGATLTRELARRGVTVVKNANVTGVATGDNLGATVTYIVGKDGEEHQAYGELALAAIGRDPNTDFDWLRGHGIRIGEGGHIEVDPWGRTGMAHVWAVGDVVAGHALAHRAFAQGVVAAEAIAGLDPEPVDEDTVPGIVFSSPEAATVGLTGAQAKADPRWTDVTETAYPMMGNARMMMGGASGAMTVVSGRPAPDGPEASETAETAGDTLVLGVHIVAPEASDLIAEAQQLVGNRVPLSRAARLIHPHPTFAETLGEALLKADGRPLHTR